MSEHRAAISWIRKGGDFLKGTFPREHIWTFDGGVTVTASSSPAAVPVPLSNPAGIDPEEAFVAAVSSCHMLTFLYVAYKAGFQIESYDDQAVGVMTKNEKGIPWISAVTLHPKIVYSGEKQPSAEEIEHLHHKAHEHCFIANSIKSEVRVEAADVRD
jgi:organic hydroperoxide reductase OsmC/OhrA